MACIVPVKRATVTQGLLFVCVILFQWQPDNDTPLILAANRDEFYARPTEAARWREDIFCGIDLRAGGTWIGITRQGRFAAVTNFREPIQEPTPGQLSRGELPWQFLHESTSPEDYVKLVARRQQRYGPFNLLVGTHQSLWYVSNRGAAPQAVAPGIHGLSNGLLDTPWPKVLRGKQLLANVIKQGASETGLLAVLTDRYQPDEADLPQTGVPDALEKLVAPIFVASAQYGTRCSTLLKLSSAGNPEIQEHRWH
jgi:uncharacterized protein with NRDE domain